MKLNHQHRWYHQYLHYMLSLTEYTMLFRSNLKPGLQGLGSQKRKSHSPALSPLINHRLNLLLHNNTTYPAGLIHGHTLTTMPATPLPSAATLIMQNMCTSKISISAKTLECKFTASSLVELTGHDGAHRSSENLTVEFHLSHHTREILVM